jgi:hypothetical protein
MKWKYSHGDNAKKQVPERTWLFGMLVRLMAPFFARLRAWESKKTIRQKKFLLVLFCASSLLVLALSLLHGLYRPVVVKPMNLPVMMLPPPRDFQNGGNKTGQLSRLLDSIKASPGGSVILDSLRKSRPGLLDSLQQIDNNKE